MKNRVTNQATVLFYALICLALSTSGCVAADKAKAKDAPAAPPPATSPVTSSAAPVVEVITSKGTIDIALAPKEAPISTENFLKLVNKGFYNGLTFHRIADLGEGSGTRMKIVQGGDPAGDGSGGPGWTIKGEFRNNGVDNPLVHDAGAVAMARSQDPDSAGSQFYICIDPAHFLDSNYAVFGHVTKGLDIADKLEQGDKMTSVKVITSP